MRWQMMKEAVEVLDTCCSPTWKDGGSTRFELRRER